MEYSYRIGNPNEINQIRDLTWLAYGQFKHRIPQENVEVWEANMRDVNTYLELFKTATCFLCEYEQKMVGSAFLIPSGFPYKWFQQEWAYIRLVAVHPNFEGQGIGKKLTQMCINQAKETGETILALHTSEFQDAARHIYEKLGFVKVKELEKMFNQQYYLYHLQL